MTAVSRRSTVCAYNRKEVAIADRKTGYFKYTFITFVLEDLAMHNHKLGA